MIKPILNNLFLLVILFFTIACEKENGNNPELLKDYETETIIQQQKFYGGVINDEGLLVTLKVPLTMGSSEYHIKPELVFLDDEGKLKNSISVDESINFRTGLSGPFDIDGVSYGAPIGLTVDFGKNTSGDIFMSNNRDKYIYKIENNQLVKFFEVGLNIQSIFCDKENNIYLLKAPVFTGEQYELITPPIILKISSAKSLTTYFTFPKSLDYQFGTGFYFDYENNNTAYLSPNSMSLFVDDNSNVYASMMVLNKVFRINSDKLETVAELNAPTDLFMDNSGDLFILQAPCYTSNKGSIKSHLPFKLINYTEDRSIYETYDFEFSNIATGSVNGYFQSAETNLLMVYDKKKDFIYIMNPLNNCVEKLY